MKKLFLYLYLCLIAQTNAQNIFNLNDVRAQIGNTGIHISGTDSQLSVPKINSTSMLYTSALWLGGINKSNDSIHLATEAYRQNGYDFKPGPIDLITNTYDSVSAINYNKIWRISQKTIDDFKKDRLKNGYIIPNEIKDWPAHGTGNFSYYLAPFVDVDNNGKYEPQNGDYPKMKGDFMFWWVFNDLGTHSNSNSKAIGVEIHGSCYAFKNIKLNENDPDYAINRSLFFNYKIINRSLRNYKNFYAGIFNDIDLGDYSDDGFAFDSANNQIIAINTDSFDSVFGKNPPMMTCQFLNQKINSIKFYQNNLNPVNGNPSKDQDYYYYLQGKNKNNSLDTQKFKQNPCDKSNIISSDIRLLSSTQKGDFNKDSAFDLTFVYSVLYDSNKNWLKEDCDKAATTAQKIKSWFDKDSFPNQPNWSLGQVSNQTYSNRISVYPNPFSSYLNINIETLNPTETAEIEIIDALGKMVLKQTTDQILNQLDLSNLSYGMYQLIIKTNNEIQHFKVLKQ